MRSKAAFPSKPRAGLHRPAPGAAECPSPAPDGAGMRAAWCPVPRALGLQALPAAVWGSHCQRGTWLGPPSVTCPPAARGHPQFLHPGACGLPVCTCPPGPMPRHPSLLRGMPGGSQEPPNAGPGGRRAQCGQWHPGVHERLGGWGRDPSPVLASAPRWGPGPGEVCPDTCPWGGPPPPRPAGAAGMRKQTPPSPLCTARWLLPAPAGSPAVHLPPAAPRGAP